MDNNELCHYGVLGMKWGVRRTPEQLGHFRRKRQERREREKAYRKKINNILQDKNINKADRKFLEYRNQSLPKRAATVAVSGITQMLIADKLTNKFDRYRRMSKTQLAKEFGKKAALLTASTTKTLALNDALSKSVANKYNDDGSLKKQTKQKVLNKEEIIGMSVDNAVKIAGAAAIVMRMKSLKAQAERSRNEEIFNRWGSNILSEKVNHVVWQSDDLRTAVIDN